MSRSTQPTHHLTVGLGDRSYPIAIGRGTLAGLGEAITDQGLSGRCAVVTDSNVEPLYLENCLASLRQVGLDPHTVVVPAGEASKSMEMVATCCSEMISAGLDRSSFLVALGGGVVGDLAGFVAAIFFRGIPFVQVPTTIVSQVDSSVGGKTGVNAPEGAGKNLIGAFHQPRLVWIDVATLDSLPDREYNEGFAEILKHAAIRDASLFELIETVRTDRSQLEELVARNVAIKAAIVEEDERETTGTRALLNFGHTIGHGIEAAARYQLLHGEAIGLGLRAAARMSVELSSLGSEECAAFEATLDGYHLPKVLPPEIDPAEVLRLLERDKKFVGGQIRFVLLRSLGEAYLSDEVDRESIRKAVAGLARPAG